MSQHGIGSPRIRALRRGGTQQGNRRANLAAPEESPTGHVCEAKIVGKLVDRPDADARAHGRGQVNSRCEPNEIFGREPIVWVGAQHTAVAVYRGDVVGAFIVRDGPNMFLAYGFGDRVLQ